MFGFGVLALACLSDVPLVSYEDVYRALEDFDAPPAVTTALRLALSKNPDERQTNVVLLKAELDKIQAQREAAFNATLPRRRCYVKITRKVEDILRKTLDHAGIEVKRFVLDDMNEICGVNRFGASQPAQRAITREPHPDRIVRGPVPLSRRH